jgi:hypothetical protein
MSAIIMTAGFDGAGVNTILSKAEADFADDGLINNSTRYANPIGTKWCAAAASTNFDQVATNLNNKYGTTYAATDLSQWVDTSGCVDGVINKFKFSSTNIAVGTVSKSPVYTVGPDDVGQCFSVGSATSGATASLFYNGSPVALATPQLAKLNDQFVLGLNASTAGDSSAFIQRFPASGVACPTTTPTSGLTKVLKYKTTDGYSISGSVSGLATGQNVTLLNNGTDPITIAANNSVFSFPKTIASGAAYLVSVSGNSSGSSCVVANNSGTANSNVTNISVTCSNTSTKLNLGTISGVNLNLISPIVVGGKTFYFVDQNGDGQATYSATAPAVDDSIDHIKLNNLFNKGLPTTAADANRSIVVGGYTVRLATQNDIFSIRTTYNYAPPPGWRGNLATNIPTLNVNFSTADLVRMYSTYVGVHYNTYMGSNTGPVNNPTGNGVFTNLYDGYGYNGLVAVEVVKN